MKKNTLKSLIAITAIVIASQLVLPAGATGRVVLSAGAADVVESRQTTKETKPESDNTKLGITVPRPTIEELKSSITAAASTESRNIAENVAVTEDVVAIEEETEVDTEEKKVVVSAGSGYISQTIPEDMQDDPNDEDELNGGDAYGYTNLGIARVEDHLNVRATADDNSKIVGKMSNNAGCEIIGVEGNKAHIVSGSVEGYVSMDYLLSGTAAIEYADGIVKNLAKVSADGLKVRNTPSLEGEVINLVAYGEELEVVEELDGWVKVLYDGEEAYVSAEYVSVGRNLKTALNMSEFLYGEGVSDVRVELCEYAKQFLGNPYVWGGTSLTKGADCSGFVLSVFAKYGIGLPHSSRAQANMGTKISMSEARPGDLVFYSKGGRINHVAIYIGGGQVIHASSPKTGIRITSAYYRTPTTVRRILQD